MKQEEVARVVRELVRDMERAGTAQPYDGYAANPLHVEREIRSRRPDVYRHITRYYGGSAYQQIKVWVPRKMS